MQSCRMLLKSALVAVVLVAMTQSGSAAEKLASCCKTADRQEITEPILGYLIQKGYPPCVQAVIFQTETGLFCSWIRAPWVHRKILAFEKAKRTATSPSVVSSSPPSSPVSLRSIITSTASPPSSSSSLPTSSSSSSSLSSSSSSSLPPSSSSSPRPAFTSTSSSPVSLLSIITSTASPPSSSSLPPPSSSSSLLTSSSSTSETPADETFSEDDEYNE